MVEQLDPIVSPNQQSQHMHRILGGSNFAAAYNSEELVASSCTTAAITVDHSSYWAPQLYWVVDPEHPDSTTFLQLCRCHVRWLGSEAVKLTESFDSLFQPILLLSRTVSFLALLPPIVLNGLPLRYHS